MTRRGKKLRGKKKPTSMRLCKCCGANRVLVKRSDRVRIPICAGCAKLPYNVRADAIAELARDGSPSS